MHTDARTLDDYSLIEGDICIVGAGAAGISMAQEWLNTKHKVILLEGGGFSYEDAMQELYAGTSTGQHYFPMKSIRLHYFGGTTGHWAGWCATFDPIDFKERDWVPHSGWPITKEDLDPYYARTQPILDLGPYEYGLEYWQHRDPSLQPLPLNSDIVWNKMWQFSPPTRFNDKYKDTIVNAPNIHLYTYANVTAINANEGVSSVTSVTVKNHAGKTHTVKARYFIIACCSVQNARLLLASNHQAPNGLGNDHDIVGRYFMEHIEIKGAELWLARPETVKLYMWQQGVQARAELAISEQMQRQHKILNGTASLIPLEVARNMQPFIQIWTDDEAQNTKTMNEYGSTKAALKIPEDFQAFQLFTRIEQAPNPNSRVTLDTEKDALGMPRARLHWELTGFEKRSIRKLHELIGQEVGRSANGRVQLLSYLHDTADESWPDFTSGGWHHMGTTRMSTDPKKGVVDANCKVHGISNLFMAGASCYATAAAPNPTLTLIALTLRLSDHIKARIKKD